MTDSRLHLDALRRVVALFLLGLLFMAILAVGIGRVCRDWGRIRPGW